VLVLMLGIAGSVAAGLTWGWLGERSRGPVLVAASAALGAEAGLLVGAAAAPAALLGCAAGWGARAAWQRRLVRGAA
jgi:hypothetical protein